jgi:exopolyphosphatase/guanosine-5'-triphosphate,3'-diphosphate pyrophosphatase
MALVKRIKDATGIDIQVITGDEEAEYIYYGVKEALDIGSDNVIVMDIGGGSVEFIICNQQHIYWKQSFEIGAQRLLDLFQPSDPILPEEIARLEAYFAEQLQPLARAVADYQPVTLIGSSGTFDTLSEMYQHRINQPAPSDATELPLTYEGYFAIAREINSKNREERLKIPGMIEMRVDMIVVACVLLSFVIKQFRLHDIRISAYALKEGVLYHTIRSLQKTMQNR